MLETAAEYAGAGVDAGLPDVDRFRAGVSRVVAKATSQHSSPETDPRLSVLLLEPSGPPVAVAHRCRRAHMLDRGREPLLGRVWFVTHVVTAGTWLPVDFERDDDFFNFVIDELGLGASPAVVFDPAPEPELRFYPSGLADDENVEPLRLPYSDVSLGEIFGAIESVYNTQLVTPGSQRSALRVWEDARQGRAVSNAEDIIGGVVSAAVQGRLPTCRIVIEQPSAVGRLDIAVDEPVPNQPGHVIHHAVLELKVLRGKNRNGTAVSAGRIKQWVEDGVVQVAAYRAARGAREAALCCFDMRREFTGRQCFHHVADLADQMEVTLEVWHLFYSAATWRQHLRSTGLLSRPWSQT